MLNIVFSGTMNAKDIIRRLGEPTVLAEKLGYPKRSGPQRCCNWGVADVRSVPVTQT